MPEEVLETAKSGVPYPPQSIRDSVGAGDFVAIGNKWKEFFVTSAGLLPEHRVLDVGCGIGRMAIPLTEVLRLSNLFGNRRKTGLS